MCAVALVEGHDASPAVGGRSRRGLRKGDQREAAIVDTARRLLVTQPATTITVEQLATGAGISRSAFYFYFESRDSVMRAVLEDVAVTLEPIITAFLTSDGPIEQRVRTLIETYLQRWRDKGHVLRAMYSLMDADPAFGAVWDDTAHESTRLVATLIEAEQQAGRALPAPPSAFDVASGLTAMLWRTGHQLSHGEPWTADADNLTDTITALCLRCVYGTTVPPQ